MTCPSDVSNVTLWVLVQWHKLSHSSRTLRLIVILGGLTFACHQLHASKDEFKQAGAMC